MEAIREGPSLRPGLGAQQRHAPWAAEGGAGPPASKKGTPVDDIQIQAMPREQRLHAGQSGQHVGQVRAADDLAAVAATEAMKRVVARRAIDTRAEPVCAANRAPDARLLPLGGLGQHNAEADGLFAQL